MRQSLLMMSIILAGLTGFLGYCWVLIDWYQDMQMGQYERKPLNLIVETLVIMAYCYLAFRFLQHQLNRSQEPDIFSSRAVKATPQPSGWFGKILTLNRSKSRG